MTRDERIGYLIGRMVRSYIQRRRDKKAQKDADWRRDYVNWSNKVLGKAREL